MAQYFAHALECWHYSDPVIVAERSAFQVVVESNQVTAKPLDKCADGKMNFRVPILGGCLGLRQEVCQSRPINCEGPRRGCRLSGSGCFARGHKVLPCNCSVTTPTFPGVAKSFPRNLMLWAP